MRHRNPSACGGTRVSLACAWLMFGVLTTAAVGAPPHVHAYCRESTTSAPGGDCSNTSGSPLLYWGRNCMTYVFNQAVFSRVPKGERFVRDAFATSFQTWADVKCSTTPSIPFLVAQASGTTTTTAAEFLYDQPNESIVVVRTRSEWASLPDHDALALALTLIWHDKKTGEILDVDMELNGGAGTFTDCSIRSACRSSNVDLQNTVTHEAGHLLGLGHSSVRGATMQPSTTSSPEITKRTLEADDRAGYCALGLPPGPCAGNGCTCPAPPIYPSHRTVSACSCRVPGQPTQAKDWSAAGGFTLLSLGSLWYRRRRSRAAKRLCHRT